MLNGKASLRLDVCDSLSLEAKARVGSVSCFLLSVFKLLFDLGNLFLHLAHFLAEA